MVAAVRPDRAVLPGQPRRDRRHGRQPRREGWRSQLVGSATVVVRATERESADAAAARAAETLAGVKGVAEARALERAKAEALMSRFLGPDPLPPDLPVPRLIAVELNPKAPATAAALRTALTAAGLDATVDDHSLWTRRSCAPAIWPAGPPAACSR